MKFQAVTAFEWEIKVNKLFHKHKFEISEQYDPINVHPEHRTIDK